MGFYDQINDLIGSALPDGDPWRVGVAHVECLRTNQTVVIHLLEIVGCPSRYAAHGKYTGVQIGHDTDGVIHSGAEEVDVRVDVLLGFHGLEDFLRPLIQVLHANFLAEGLRHVAQVMGTWVEGFVHTVTKAHDLLLALEFALHELDDVDVFVEL